MTFLAPAVVIGDVGVAPAGSGAPQGDRSQGVNGAFSQRSRRRRRRGHYLKFVHAFRTDDDELTRNLQRAHVNDGKGV